VTDRADVLVVGAGPAGSAAAYHLARRGVDVLVVDRATFPREKVCGDGLTPYGVRALQRMGIEPTEPGFTQVRCLRSYGVDGVVVDLPWPKVEGFPTVGVVRTRYEFDHLLLTRAEQAGARVLQGVEATAPLVEGGWVAGANLSRDGSSWEARARFVIAADGASSRFGRQAGVVRDDTKPVSIAARRYYRIPRKVGPVLESFLSLPDRRVGLMCGYGWIFPLGDGLVNVGAGLSSTYTRFSEFSARKVMDLFLRQLPPEWGIDEEHAEGPLMSGPIPMGLNRKPAAVPGLLLVGDAVGATNPFNGEGIAYGMETGELAAELVGDALARNRPAVAQMYPVVLRERYGRYFKAGSAWMWAIGHPRFLHFAVRHGFPRKPLMRFALRIMANLTRGEDGDTADRLMHALVSVVPSVTAAGGAG